MPWPGAALLGYLRQDLLEPVQAVVTLGEVLLQEAADRPEEFLADVHKLHQAARRLLAFLEEALDASRAEFRRPLRRGCTASATTSPTA